MKKIKDTTHLLIEGVLLNVSYEYFKDSGYLRDSDGHGLPPAEDLEITSIKIGGLECYPLLIDTWIIESIENQILDSLND
jgi:hypothetical protein